MADLVPPTPSEPPFRLHASDHLLDDAAAASGEAPRPFRGATARLPDAPRCQPPPRRLRRGARRRAPERRGLRRRAATGRARRRSPARSRGRARADAPPRRDRVLPARPRRQRPVVRERALTDLARTELQRATCFVQGLQVLGEDPVLTRRSLRLVELIEQALGAVEPERRLAGVEACWTCPGWTSSSRATSAGWARPGGHGRRPARGDAGLPRARRAADAGRVGDRYRRLRSR